MSVEFSNTYQEILLENLMSIIKQNFMFQTQLKMVEETGTQKAELEAKLAEAQNQYNAIRPLVEEIESYKQRALQNTSAHQEKDRIQTALNDYMRKHADLQAVIAERDGEIGKLKEYIDKLEQAVPVSKLKKINPEKKFEEPAPVIVPEEPPPTTTKQVVKDGSSF
jgi:DNA repair exonuclease SbcCD ATPase subunit